MYVCGSCRGAAVIIMETGLLGVWQWAPLNDFFVHVFASVGGGCRYLYDAIYVFLIFSPLHDNMLGICLHLRS